MIKEVKYIQAVTKFDRLHYKYLSKKRAFLARQVRLTRTLMGVDQHTEGLRRMKAAYGGGSTNSDSESNSDSDIETSIDLDLSSRTSKGKSHASRGSSDHKKRPCESLTHSLSPSEQLEGGSRDKDGGSLAEQAPIEFSFSAEEVGFSQKVIDKIYNNDQAQKHFRKLQAKYKQDIEAGAIDETQARFLFLDKLKEFIRKQILKKQESNQIVAEDDGDDNWEDKRRLDGKIEAAFLR